MIKVAIMYDFDKTLSTKDMQEFSFIESIGYESSEMFWEIVNKLKNDNKMDSILAYMYMMLQKSKENNMPIRKSDFIKLGKHIEFFPGVLDYFERINQCALKMGIELEHYIISSGLTEIIEGTSIGKQFKKIYACKYLYDANQVAVWPSLVVNYTTKTQYIYRINKQVLDESNDVDLNSFNPNKRPIPFNRMIYIGDGITDVPCFKLVKEQGGKSIVVYPKDSPEKEKIAKQFVVENRAHFAMMANYEKGSQLDYLLINILENIKTTHVLEQIVEEGKK